MRVFGGDSSFILYVEHHQNLRLEQLEHTHIIVSRDESFVHEMHNGDYSLLPKDEQGNLIHDMNTPVRNGRRICMSGGITTTYGHLTGYYQISENKWVPYKDCEWRNKDNVEVSRNGRFVELTGNFVNNVQQVRAIFYRKPAKPVKLCKLTKSELQHIASESGLPISTRVPSRNGTFSEKICTKLQLIESIEKFRRESTGVIADAN